MDKETMCRQQRRAMERDEVKKYGAKWTPFVQVSSDRTAVVGNLDAVAKQFGVPLDVVREVAAETFSNAKLYLNSIFEVEIKPATQPNGWLHLAVRRRNGVAGVTWAENQHIKDELVGPDCEGIELLPAAARLRNARQDFPSIGVCPNPAERLAFGFHGSAADLPR